MEKHTGVWVDKKKAFIISYKGNEESVEEVLSDFDGFNFQGGSGNKGRSPWGPQDIGAEKQFQNRQANQLDHFYKIIADKLTESNQILLFGPGEAKQGLHKVVSGNHQLKDKIAGIEAAEPMTVNQLKKHVKDYFNK